MAEDGLGAELARAGNRPARCGCRVEQAGIGFGGLGECPSPALAVVPGSCEALGHAVIDGRAVGLDGCPGLLAAP